PTNQPPHKDTHLAAAGQRLRMVELAVGSNRCFGVLDWEIKRGSISYTIDTLKQLKRKYRQKDFFLIIGADLANAFNSWRDYRKIIRLVKIVVVKRKDFPVRQKGDFIFMDMPHVGITSSLVREYLKKGMTIRYLVPDSVERYIKKHRLYLSSV
ncbi:MAG: nicotinate (nicotinamide) nucleotide adenylyltransferase, partial [Candidatus Omnitrophota bacterium]